MDTKTSLNSLLPGFTHSAALLALIFITSSISRSESSDFIWSRSARNNDELLYSTINANHLTTPPYTSPLACLLNAYNLHNLIGMKTSIAHFTQLWHKSGPASFYYCLFHEITCYTTLYIVSHKHLHPISQIKGALYTPTKIWPKLWINFCQKKKHLILYNYSGHNSTGTNEIS